MNETRTINLNGLVYHIDKDAYQVLKDYLDDIEMRLPTNDRKEVMTDIESRIAELFQKALFAKNTQVVTIEMVNTIQSQIGAPTEFGENRRPKVKVDKSQNTGCGRVLSIVLNVILAILALPMIFIAFIMVITLFAVAVAGSATVGATFPIIAIFTDMLVEGTAFLIPLLIIALIAIVVLPIVMIVYTIVTYMRTRRGPKARFWWITILCWLAAIIFWGASLVRLYHTIDHAPQILKSMRFEGMDVDDETGLLSSTLQLDAFHSIQLSGAAELHLSNAAEQSTILTTSMMPLMEDEEFVKAEVRDSILYIDATNVLSIEEMMVDFTITSPSLRKITVYGASKIETLDGHPLQQSSLTLDLNGAAEADLHLYVDSLSVETKGASRLELEGTATSARISIAGAGDVEAESLVVQKMHINCAGASEAEVHVQRELWAQAAGASKITYKGNPSIKQNIAVGGSLIRKDR